jgi:outer membrane protein assembly factor BamB
MRRIGSGPLALVAAMVATCALVRAGAGADANWPQLRGPGAMGVSEASGFPDTWSATQNVAWKTDIPGRGWSSPVVWGNRVFLTTVCSQGATEPPKKGLYMGGERPQTSGDLHEWWVYCLDLPSGKVLWKQMVHSGKPPSPIHVKNSYASETPVADADRVYCVFGNVGIYALTHAGRKVWQRALTPHPIQAAWGTAASPALAGGRLYVVDDNEAESSIAALDARTGKDVWRVSRDEKSNWATPFVWKNSRRTEIITAGTGKVRSYDLDGRLLWWLKGVPGITISTPYASGDLLYVTSGYVGSPRRPIYAIRPGGAGDISLAEGATSGEFIAWRQPTAAPYNPSTLLYRGQVYVLLDFGMMSAYDAATGAPLFERTRIPEGRAFTASPWAAGGKVYCMNEDGVTFVFRAGPRFDLLHTNKLAEDDMGMACPAITGNRLLIRTSARVYCISRPRR